MIDMIKAKGKGLKRPIRNRYGNIDIAIDNDVERSYPLHIYQLYADVLETTETKAKKKTDSKNDPKNDPKPDPIEEVKDGQ